MDPRIPEMILMMATPLDRDLRFMASTMPPTDKKAMVQMWMETLHPDTTMEDAKRAVAEHYKTESRSIMPVHVNHLTAKYRAERVNLDLIQVPYPDGLADEPHLEVKWRAVYLEAIKTGSSHETATIQAWNEIGRDQPLQLPSPLSIDAKNKLEQLKQKFGKGKKK